ncbi:uncharacterized protein V6R79_001903 [Siganus canaliculatus]
MSSDARARSRARARARRGPGAGSMDVDLIREGRSNGDKAAASAAAFQRLALWKPPCTDTTG